MKIILTDILKSLDGENLKHGDKDLTIAVALGTILISEKSNDPLRNYLLGQDIYGKTEIELNKSDLDFVKKSVGTSVAYYPLVLGQLLIILDEKKPVDNSVDNSK